MRSIARVLCFVISLQLAVPQVVVARAKPAVKAQSATNVTLQKLIPVIDHKGKKYVVSEKFHKSGKLETRIIVGPQFSEIIFDRDGNGFADEWKITRGKIALHASMPYNGKFLQLEVFESLRDRGVRHQVFIYNRSSREYVLKEDKTRKAELAAKELATPEECSDKSLDLLALRTVIDHITTQTGISDPVKAMSCRLQQLQNLMFDPSCLDPKWAESLADIREGWAEVLVSGSTKPSSYISCLSEKGLKEEAAGIQEKMYGNYLKAIGTLSGSDNSAFQEMINSKTCDPVKSTAASQAAGGRQGKLIFCGPNPNWPGKEADHFGLWDGAGDGQMTIYENSKATASRNKCSASESYAKTIFHEILHSSENLGRNKDDEEKVVRLAENCCNPLNGDSGVKANACGELADFGYARSVVRNYHPVFIANVPGFYEFSKDLDTSAKHDMTSRYYRALVESNDADFTSHAQCLADTDDDLKKCAAQGVERLVANTEKFFNEKCGARGALAQGASAIKRAFTGGMSRAQCDTQRDVLVAKIRSGNGPEMMAKLYPKDVDPVMRNRLSTIVAASKFGKEDALGSGIGTGTDIAQAGSTVPAGPSTPPKQDKDPIGDLIAAAEQREPKASQPGNQMNMKMIPTGSGLDQAGSTANPGASTLPKGQTVASNDLSSGRPGETPRTQSTDLSVGRPGSTPKVDAPSRMPNLSESSQLSTGQLGQVGSRKDFVADVGQNIERSDSRSRAVIDSVRPDPSDRRPSSLATTMAALTPKAFAETPESKTAASAVSTDVPKITGVDPKTAKVVGSNPVVKTEAGSSGPRVSGFTSSASTKPNSAPQASSRSGGGSSGSASGSPSEPLKSKADSKSAPAQAASGESAADETESKDANKKNLEPQSVAGGAQNQLSVGKRGRAPAAQVFAGFAGTTSPTEFAAKLSANYDLISIPLQLNKAWQSDLGEKLPYGWRVQLANTEKSIVYSLKPAPEVKPGQKLPRPTCLEQRVATRSFVVGVCKP